MSKLEIGIGALIAVVAGLGIAKNDVFVVALSIFGAILIVQGAYDVYLKPNLWLERSISRWLKRQGWRVARLDAPKDAVFFVLQIQDEAGRKIQVSRQKAKALRSKLIFVAPIELHEKVVAGVSRLSPATQQRLYQDLHVLLSTMHIGFRSPKFTDMVIAADLPIDDALSEHQINARAEDVSHAYNAARSLIRRAAITDTEPFLP